MIRVLRLWAINRYRTAVLRWVAKNRRYGFDQQICSQPYPLGRREGQHRHAIHAKRSPRAFLSSANRYGTVTVTV
jgi:hypothetical protein